MAHPSAGLDSVCCQYCRQRGGRQVQQDGKRDKSTNGPRPSPQPVPERLRKVLSQIGVTLCVTPDHGIVLCGLTCNSGKNAIAHSGGDERGLPSFGSTGEIDL